MRIINEEVGGIAVTGSADGLVRLYRNYDPTLEQGPLQMVSAFRGLNEVIQVRQGSGVVMDWKQASGILLVGGDARVIRAWDAQTETPGLVSAICYRGRTILELCIGYGHQLGQPRDLDCFG